MKTFPHRNEITGMPIREPFNFSQILGKSAKLSSESVSKISAVLISHQKKIQNATKSKIKT
jgi:hypothetical protein